MSDTSYQTLEVGKIALNQNSVKQLNRIPWSTPKQRIAAPCVLSDTDDERLRYYLDGQPCSVKSSSQEAAPPSKKRHSHWRTVEELWEALDAANVSYALLRNFEAGVIGAEAHPDIDLLLG